MVIIKGNDDDLYRHRLPDGKVVTGLLHFYKKDGKWVYVPESETSSHVFPDICFAIKCPIEDIESKNWPDLEGLSKQVFAEGEDDNHIGFKCGATGDDIKGPLYRSKCISGKTEVSVNFSKETILQDHQEQSFPLIFYRLKKKLL